MKFILIIISLITFRALSASIIGGKVADESTVNDGVFEFGVPSATIPGAHSFCTATKIGDNIFITAGHCFNVNRSPTVIKFNTKIKNEKKKYDLLEVEHLKIHDQYQKGGKVLMELDIAIVVIKPNPIFSNLTTQLIDFSHVESKTLVEYFGFGCEDSNNQSMESISVKRHAENLTLSESILKKKFGILYTEYVNYYSKEIYRIYLLTAGLTLSKDRSSLCVGDSGGPVFINNKLVGINVTYLDDFDKNGRTSKGLSYINLHLRLSMVKSWIQKTV